MIKKITLIIALTAAINLFAQELEPRTYSNIPMGLNFLISGYAYTHGDLSFGPNLPIVDAQIHTSSGVIGYLRSFNLAGKSAKIDVIVPYTWLDGSALYQGEPITKSRVGFADPKIRISVNLIGAPALAANDFRSYKQNFVLGISFQATVPIGQYDPSRLINLGTNRWSVKSEIGASKKIDKWLFELAASTTFYEDNTDFFGGNKRSQGALFAIQGHIIYNFGKKGAWIAMDGTYFEGGRSKVNTTINNDLQQNWRVGGTFGMPLSKSYSLKFYLSSGVSARTGNNFDLIGTAIQYRWSKKPSTLKK